MCAVDQKKPFFPRAGPFLDLLPFKGPFSLTGALAGPPYGKAPYGEAYGKAGPLQEARYEEGRSLREGPGSRTGGRSLWKGRGPLRVLHKEGRRRGLREGRALTGNPLALTGRPTYEKASYGEASYRKAPYREASYEKAPYELQERLREAMGQTLPELGGNFRLCAVDQKRPFFPRAGPFLDLLPFKGPFSLTGALTGPPYGKVSYGRAGPLQEAPYEEGRSLREGPVITGALTGRPPYGKAMGTDFTRIWRKRPFFPGAGPFLDLLPFKRPFSLTGALTGPPYGKVSYGEASYGKAGPLQLRGGTVLTGRAGAYRSPYGQTALREGPLRGGFLREGPLRITGKLTRSYGEGLYQNWAGISACVP